ncbi:4Fe-4S dicluster domain-containing protein [Sedimentibacter hydroxybenzoicus DSM 7310]|uniref:4Fe-4S dicluster domain-containing protein n=1 Tax=Sedimentibacter hydroxybenzoicus DSM 7310 TaxID=1123245 RepID=A0A974BL84_SEDHY|nr:4Fe-4S dicluster domain-containing protein [Sedimentibacter hydroxybenzoicus]NYB75132.1 4Fe-4S dicluster domain-containing protein [Sedimentibacter hydroxybenzoicus DSM 7310]
MILDYLIYSLTKDNPPKLNKDKCINTFMKGCHICEQSCREKAISEKNGNIFFDGKLCNECGVCRVKCPTQAIMTAECKDEEILTKAAEKQNLVISCSLSDTIGNLKVSCLNSLHPELIACMFILYEGKKIYFNLSSCIDCEHGYDEELLRDSLNKALKFVKSMGVNPSYEIHEEEDNLSELATETISRRNLFKMVKKESGSMVVKTISSIVHLDESNDSQISIRKTLLKLLKSDKIINNSGNSDVFWECWEVNENCDGCGRCVSVCPGKAWKIENTDTTSKLYHNMANCFKCGLCKKACDKKALNKGNIDNPFLDEFNLKREILFNICNICSRKYIPKNKEDEKCDICKKKELLREKISAL